MRFGITILIFVLSFALRGQGSFSPAVGFAGTTAIHKDSSDFVSWATAAVVYRGYVNAADKSLGQTTVGDAFSVLGQAQANGVLSLGDSGYADLQFNGKLFDGPGPDFAVFENAFDAYFLELAFVEVSSNGLDFFRFPAQSLTDTSAQVNAFDSLEAVNVHNLAGKYESGYGVPFDLAELSGIPNLDIQAISHVRIVDVVGSINPLYGSRDVMGRKVNDPFPTPFPSGGFDLDAVGAIHINSTSLSENKLREIAFYPNPASSSIYLDESFQGAEFSIRDAKGILKRQELLRGSEVNIEDLQSGIYFIFIEQGGASYRNKLIVR